MFTCGIDRCDSRAVPLASVEVCAEIGDNDGSHVMELDELGEYNRIQSEGDSEQGDSLNDDSSRENRQSIWIDLNDLAGLEAQLKSFLETMTQGPCQQILAAFVKAIDPDSHGKRKNRNTSRAPFWPDDVRTDESITRLHKPGTSNAPSL